MAFSQRMSERDLDGLKGKVKVVQKWNQKFGIDAKPVEEPKTESETIYDETGNVIETTSHYGFGRVRTTYFDYKGERVSRNENLDGDPPEIKRPEYSRPAVKKKKDGPYDYKYKYKYDSKGRIVEINGQDAEYSVSSNTKYKYDESGKMVSDSMYGFGGGVENKRSFKYDGDIVSEVVFKCRMHTNNSIQNNTTTVRYSNYKFDNEGNWVQRVAKVIDKKGNVSSITLDVRFFVYF